MSALSVATKTVQFQCFKYPTIDIVVNSPRTQLDNHGNPHYFPGKTVAFHGGILETVDPDVIEHIRSIELYGKGVIVESEGVKPLNLESVKVIAGGKGTGQRKPEVIEAIVPIEPELKAKAVRVPKRTNGSKRK